MRGRAKFRPKIADSFVDEGYPSNETQPVTTFTTGSPLLEATAKVAAIRGYL